jgi:hypothetical protein
MAKKPKDQEPEVEQEETAESEPATEQHAEPAMAEKIEYAPEEYIPVAVGKREVIPPRLVPQFVRNRASLAYYRRVRQILQSLGKYTR